MKYLSVCSGIEAATVAWHPLGWKPVAFSEIEPFPSAVLKHHYPSVPNLGDMTKHESWPIDVGSVDLLVGGTPCQSFSVAGLRKGLSDPRGGLMLTYLEIARRLRPRWVVWENVPGVLSSNGGRDFGSFLGALGELGYGWAYRVLDAQWVRTQRHPRAVPQRRRRVFVVGCLGDATAAAAVLFERESVCRDPAPRRAKGQGAPADAESCSGTVSSKWAKGTGGPSGDECYNLTVKPIVIDRAAFNQGENAQYDPIVRHDDAMPSMVARGPHAVAHGFYSTDGTHGVNMTPVAMRESGQGYWMQDDIAGSLRAEGENRPSRPSHVIQQSSIAVHSLPDAPKPPEDQVCIECGNDLAVAENWHCLECLSDDPKLPTMAHGFYSTGGTHGVNMTPELSPAVKVGSGLGIPSPPAVAHRMTVRRLTPRECERLQAFPDDWTLIPWRGKSADDCPDGPRYKALGNSMAVNCMEWIGERIAAYEEARP